MGKRVILTLMQGSFEQGFPVILWIREDGAASGSNIQVVGHLPPAPRVRESFDEWQLAYRQTVMPSARLTPKPIQVTNVSCQQLGLELEARLNHWLNSDGDWQKIRDRLQRSLSETDEIQIIIETDNPQLQQLPWHLWDLFSEHYTNAEIALSAPDYQPLPPSQPTTHKVRILAILGNSTGIDVQRDRAILEQLPDVEITFLIEPQRQQLNNQLWEQPWDILFFAGHSYSQGEGDTGQICINRTDSLSIAELKNGLRRAITQGLQLAIFNSCDGLGLARELTDLHIPQIVVMREPVPDLVAQEFLQYFLRTFAEGKSLYLAVREARERLQGLEAQFPCATWLPVICQNPAQVSPTWQGLSGRVERTQSSQRGLRSALLAGGVIVALLIGVRPLGMSQPLQPIFQPLSQLQPAEKIVQNLPIPNVIRQLVVPNRNQVPLVPQGNENLQEAKANSISPTLVKHPLKPGGGVKPVTSDTVTPVQDKNSGL